MVVSRAKTSELFVHWPEGLLEISEGPHMVREVGFRATGQVYRSRWFDRTVEGPVFVSLRAHAAPLPEHYDSGPSTIFLQDFRLTGPAPSPKSSEDPPYSLRRRNSFPQNQFSSERSQNLPEVNWNVLNIDLIQHFLRQYGNRDAAIAGLEVLCIPPIL